MKLYFKNSNAIRNQMWLSFLAGGIIDMAFDNCLITAKK